MALSSLSVIRDVLRLRVFVLWQLNNP